MDDTRNRWLVPGRGRSWIGPCQERLDVVSCLFQRSAKYALHAYAGNLIDQAMVLTYTDIYKGRVVTRFCVSMAPYTGIAPSGSLSVRQVGSAWLVRCDSQASLSGRSSRGADDRHCQAGCGDMSRYFQEGPSMQARTALGAVIKARRIELGWTQEELAERISDEDEYVRQSEISRIENGKIALPRRERLERIARALDLPLGELLARSGWAGAEPHFQPPADSRTGLDAPPPVVEASRPDIVVRSRGDTRNYDPAAMAAFRRALAAMREQSDRLQRNRNVASVVQQHFRALSDDDRARHASGDYSDTADG